MATPLDTRASLNYLLDYETVFNEIKNTSDAIALIDGIPSINLLHNISNINRSLYLNESGEAGQKNQNAIIMAFTFAGSLVLKKIIEAYREVTKDGMSPKVFYRYSNLLFYDLIFSTYNQLPIRNLSPEENEKILRAYLIINGEVNSRVRIEEKEAAEAFDGDKIEEIMLHNFIYQNDYKSNVDYSNQFTRAVRFFQYLDLHPKYGAHMPAFYKNLKITNASEFIFKIAAIFNQIIGIKEEGKGTIITMAGDPLEEHNQLLLRLAVDMSTFRYKKDESFRQFRNQMFFLTPNKKLILLDINFLIDFLYKTQVFALSKFFEKKSLNNFLADKSIEFMEQRYLHEILNRCFPKAKKYSGKALIKKDKNELTDFVVTDGNKMLLIEFKDTILSAKSKNSGDKTVIADALDAKFLEDEGPKGITQLKNAIKYLDNHTGNQNEFPFSEGSVIYPIVIYTDNAFGFDGINKIYKEKFCQLLQNEKVTVFEVKDVTFINLSFFEINEDYLKSGELDIFKLIEFYHEHTRLVDFSMTPFEVFATSYRKETVKRQPESTTFFKDMIAETQASFLNVHDEMKDHQSL
nr:hypothetical protein [Mucilaginibacter sp. L294]